MIDQHKGLTSPDGITYRLVPLEWIIPNPENYNQHPREQIDALKADFKRFGQVKPYVVKQQEETRFMLSAGEGCTIAAGELLEEDSKKYENLGWAKIVVVPDWWTDDDVIGFMAADNQTGRMSIPDEEKLLHILQRQKEAGYDLLSLGSDEETLRQMLANRDNEWVTQDEEVTPQEHTSLADRFIIPPFSVLDARQGYWQERKRAWIALGIQSELGRGENALQLSVEDSTDSLNYYRNQGKNGLLGESEQARSHYKESTLGAIPPNERDILSRSGKYATNGKGKEHNQGLLKFSDAGNDPEYYYKKQEAEKALGRELSRAEIQRDFYEGPTTLQSGTSIFDPVICELAYRWFSPPAGTVLDPFAGGSVRGIVAAKTGRQYIGIDLRQEQVTANEQQAQRILSKSASILVDASDPSEDNTPDLTPVMEHGGYLVKRDDLFQIAGVRGGKVRTVWALAQGAKGLVTSGSRHSPHVHRVAAIAQRLGIPCRIHIATGENTPDVQGAEDAGAEIIRHKAGYLNVLNARAREDAEQSGWTLIPFGVVCQEAVRQIKHQTANLPHDMKRLVVAVGSGVSLSGILHGLQEQGRHVPILGVSVGKDPVAVLDEYAPKDWRKTVTLIQSPLKFEEHPKETRLGDIPLDPTYEAKCLPYLQEDDVLWSIGLRASEVDTTDVPQALMPNWIVGDSRNIDTLCPDVQADLIFTCPPYYDLEVYSDNPDDLSVLGTYDEFLQVYRNILKQAIAKLKDNRFVCVVVGDIRDKKGFYRNFVGDTIAACQDAGARLYNEAILVTSVGSLPIRVGKQFSSGRKLGKTHQNVLVFCKGDPLQAVRDCGPVVVEIPEEEETDASFSTQASQEATATYSTQALQPAHTSATSKEE